MVSAAGTEVLNFQSPRQDTCLVRVKSPSGSVVAPGQKLLSLDLAGIWSQFPFVVWGPVPCLTFRGFPALHLVCDHQRCLQALPSIARRTESPLIKNYWGVNSV